MMSIFNITNIMIKVIRTFPMDMLCIIHNFLCSIMSLMGIQPNLLKRPTDLSVPAFKITLTGTMFLNYEEPL